VEADVGPHHRADLLDRIDPGVKHRPAQLVVVFLVTEKHELGQKLLFGLEVGIHRARPDPRRVGDLSDRDAVEAPVPEENKGCFEQPAVGSVGRGPRWQQRLACGGGDRACRRFAHAYSFPTAILAEQPLACSKADVASMHLRQASVDGTAPAEGILAIRTTVRNPWTQCPEMPPEFFDVQVAGGALNVARWGGGRRVVLGIHGITASSLSLAPIARHLDLDAGAMLVAPDLRGRGVSNRLPGPYGMLAHANDCAAVLEHVGGTPAVVVGESMGAWVAEVLAARRPELVERLVLVDGGLPTTVPATAPHPDIEAALAAILGPALSRLARTFATPAAYVEFWRAHPAVRDDWNEDLEAYVLYDLEAAGPPDGGFRPRAAPEAVRTDGAEVLRDPKLVREALAVLTCPINLLRATRNLLNELPPLLTDDVVAQWRARLPQLVDEVVDDTNHYTIMFGERGAKTIARRTQDDHRLHGE